MPIPPWVSLTVSIIALIGVLVTALVTYLNARKARETDEARRIASEKHSLELQAALVRAQEEAANRRAAHEKELADLRGKQEMLVQEQAQRFAESMANRQKEFGEALEQMRHENQEHLRQQDAESKKELETIRASLSAEADNRRILVSLNEENFRHVHQGIRKLRDVGFAMSAAFRTLARSAHAQIDLPEDQLVADSLTALRRHEEFRVALRELRGEIRPKDYDELEQLLRYLVIVFLDVGRTPEERSRKIDQMKTHESAIEEREDHFEVLVKQFLQPYSRPRSGA